MVADSMPSQGSHASPVSQASTVLLEVVDRLSAEFPEVPLSVIYQMVGEARAVAASLLPDVAEYGEALEREATIRLRLDQSRVGPDISLGRVGP